MKHTIFLFFRSVGVGYFLAVREIRRANIWTTSLITFVMTLTFLNLIVIRGILVGLTEGSVQSYKQRYTGNIILSTLDKKQYIEDSHLAIGITRSLPYVKALSPRYIASGIVEADYKIQTRRDEGPDKANAVFVGINPHDEDAVTSLSRRIVKGVYLDPNKQNQILIGVSLLQKYQSAAATGSIVLKNADVGSTVRITVNNISREVAIVGVVKAKVTNVDNRVFMLDRELRSMMNRTDFNVNEIAVLSDSDAHDGMIKSILQGNAIDQKAKVQTWREAQPQFIRDIAATFQLLGDVIGAIGLAVASVTIFIVIFINAITRRKYIGILKGIGINAVAIESSYIFQSIFYALGGTSIGLILVYGLIVPFFSDRPIDFPFSDGIFVADPNSVFLRVGILFVATVIAGFIPARIVVKQGTLDAILGR